MIFNFFLGNHSAADFNWFADLLLPIYEGLGDCGHRVIGCATGMLGAPAVNVFVERFERDDFVDQLLRMKATQGERFIFGILCAEDIFNDAVTDAQNERRRANLLRILPATDFVWTLAPPSPAVAAVCRPGQVAMIEYGFCEALQDRYMAVDPAQRDVDAILYGSETPYRARVSDALTRQGFHCFVSDREAWPNFMTDDIIRRAKVLIDVRRGPHVRFLTPTRIAKGLHSGTAVVSERFDDSEIGRLYSYTEACAYEEVADRCGAIIRGGAYLETGLAALARFRAETSMRDNVARALAMPIFGQPA